MTEENEKNNAQDPEQKNNDEKKDEKNNESNLPALMKAEEILQKFEKKEAELTERENALNEKIKSFDQAMAKAKLGGFGIMHKEKSEDEKNIEAANKLLAGSGFKVNEKSYDAFSQK